MQEPSRSSAIVLTGVTKSYDGKVALAPTTLEVPAHRCLVLIGPSGCGKSTLLRLVIGLLRPDGGTIEVGGVPVTSATVQSLRLRMGYVIQEGGLFPHLTSAGNVSLVAREQGMRREAIAARLVELSELTHLPRELLDR